MSAPVQLEVKFLDVLGDYYHMPNGSTASREDRKLGIPLYVDFLKHYGFNNPKLKKTTGTGLVAGVATEEEAEFIKYFGVPYIYGPSLVSQRESCRPANYAKIKDFLAYRLVTIESQINNPLTVSSGSSLSVQKYKKIKDKLKGYLKEMDSTKQLPVCDDYKIDYFQDDSDLMNYLTRALYYGLKPEAGTDEHVKCVNLFRDSAGAGAELQALLEIVKDKRKDGMLSFMELVGSSLAGLIQKINQDRSFATATIGAASTTAASTTATGTASSTYLDTIRTLHNQLIVFFDEISKSDSGEIGKKTFIKGKPIPEFITQFTTAVTASKKYLTSTGSTTKPTAAAFPATVEDLKKKIMDELKMNPFDPVGKVYDTNMKNVLEALRKFLENGPVTSAAVGNMIDKITLINAFKDADVVGILKSYLLFILQVTKDPPPISESDKSIINSYQKLFAIFNTLGLFDELKTAKNIENNLKLDIEQKVNYKGKEYSIALSNCYINGNFKYGYFVLTDNSAGTPGTLIVFFDEELTQTSSPNPLGDILNKYDNFTIGSTIEISTGTPEIIREKHLFISIAPMSAAAATSPLSENMYLTVKNNKTYDLSKVTNDATRLVSYKIQKPTLSTGVDPTTNGEEKFDLGAASTGTGGTGTGGTGTGGTGTGGTGTGVDPAVVAALRAELATAKAALDTLRKERTTAGIATVFNELEIIQKTDELATAISEFKRVNDELTALKATPDAEKIADLERRLAELRTLLSAKTAAATNAISTATTDLGDLDTEKKRLEAEIIRLQGEIDKAGTFTRTGPLKEELQANSSSLITNLEQTIVRQKALIDNLTKLNTTLTTEKTAIATANADLEALLATAQAAVTKATADLATAQTELAEAQRLKQAADDNLATEQARCATLQTELDTLIASGTASADRIRELEAALAAAQAAAGAADAGGAAAPDAALQTRIATQEARIAELTTQLAEAQTSRGAADTEKADALQRADAAETTRAAAQAERDQAAAALAAAQASQARAEEELTRLRIAGGTSEEEIARLSAAAEAAKVAAVTAVREQFNAAQAEAEAARTRASSAEAARTDLDAQIASLRDELTAARQSAGDLETQLRGRSKLTAAEETALHTELTAAQTRAAALEARVAALTTASGDTSAKDDMISNLTKQVAAKEAEKGALRTEIETTQRNLNAAQEAARKALREKTEAEGRVKRVGDELTAARAAATTESTALKARITDLERELADAKKAAEDAKAKIPPSQEEIYRLTAAKLQLERELQNIQTGIATGREIISGLATRQVELERKIGSPEVYKMNMLLRTIERLEEELKNPKSKSPTGNFKESEASFYKASAEGHEAVAKRVSDELAAVRANLLATQQQMEGWGQMLRNKDRRIAELGLEAKPVKAQTDAGKQLNLSLQLFRLKTEKEALEKEVARLKATGAAKPDDDPTIRELLETIRAYIKTKGLTSEKFSEMEEALGEVAGLESLLTKKEEEIKQLVANLEAALSRAAAAEGSLDVAKVSLEMTNLSLEEEIENRKKLEEELLRKTEQYLSQIRELEEKLGNIYKEYIPVEYVDHEYNVFKERIKELEKQLREKEKVVNDVRTIFVEESSSEKPQASQRKLNRLKDANKKLKQGLISKKDMIPKEKHEELLGEKDSEIEDLTAQLAAVEEARKNAIAATEAAHAELQAENQALQVENEGLKTQLATLNATIEKMRSESKAQTFGSLSGMLSSPAFKAATIGVFTNFAGKKRDAYNNANVNRNLRSSLPGEGEGLESSDALRSYYIQTLQSLATELKIDENTRIVSKKEEIQWLANLLKLMSSPLTSGIYKVNNMSYPVVADSDNKEKTLESILKSVNLPTYNSIEPSLYISMSKPVVTAIETDSKIVGILDTIFKNFIDNNQIYLFFPSIRIADIETNKGEAVGNVEKEEEVNTYLTKIKANLFDITNNYAKQINFFKPQLAKENEPTLADFKEGGTSFFAKRENGILISRSEIVGIFMKSLLSALKTAWGL